MFFFFFSSRRRHTSSKRDWSSDVCSSDLAGLKAFAPEALMEYRRCFRDPAAIHASCEDYRAAESIDLAHDEADIDRKVAAPLLVLWGKYGTVERCFHPLADWAERAENVH